MLESNSSIDYDDDLMPEIDINQIQPEKLVRGKHYQAIQQHGYSVTVQHEDGTSTCREVTPEEVSEQMRQREQYKQSPQYLLQKASQTMRIQHLDIVALIEDLPDRGLSIGQVGTIAKILAPDVYEVDFRDDQGQTYAMLPLHHHQLLRLKYSPDRQLTQI
jgi:Domain of unknown function (DUF4926)